MDSDFGNGEAAEKEDVFKIYFLNFLTFSTFLN